MIVDPVAQPHLAMPDERFRVAENGLVDCFLCAHKVSVLAANRVSFQMDTVDVGPELFCHTTCRDGFSPHQVWILYNLAMRGCARNLGHGGGLPGRDADLLLYLR